MDFNVLLLTGSNRHGFVLWEASSGLKFDAQKNRKPGAYFVVWHVNCGRVNDGKGVA